MPALTLFLLAATAWAVPADRAGDAVLKALADESPRTAVRLLSTSLRTTEPDAEADLRCLLGHAQRAAGDLTSAVATWEAVPMDAGCGLRAGFDRADALTALGRPAEAATVYDTYGWTRLGPGRDGLAWAQIEHLLDTLHQRATPTTTHVAEIQALWTHSLQLDLPEPTRLEAALGAARHAVANDQRGDDAAQALLDLLREGAIPQDLRPEAARLAGTLSEPGLGLRLLDAHDDGSIAHAAARARIIARIDAPAGLLALEAVVESTPEDPDLRRELARALDASQRIGEARRHWLALHTGPHSAEAGLRLARIDARIHSDSVRAAAAPQHWLRSWLRDHPLHANRAEVELELAALRHAEARALAAAGRHSEAATRYIELLDDDPAGLTRSELEWETAAAELASGDRAAAMARWEQMLAQSSWPDRAMASLVSAKAEADPTAAMGWLQARAEEAGPLRHFAAAELSRRSSPAIALLSGRSASDEADLLMSLLESNGKAVRARVRNVDSLSLRVHHIDAEAFLRAGGRAASLSELDVAVIAPDSERTVTLSPGTPGIDREVELPLDLRKPGIYAVTADIGTHQAQVVVRYGKGSVLTRAIEGQLILAALRDGRPDPGARVLVALGDKVHEARTDRSGIARITTPQQGLAQVLVLGHSGPLLTEVQVSAQAKPSSLAFSADLSQPVVLPGSHVGARLVGRRDHAPITGRWRLWLQADQSPGPSIELTASRLGTLHGTLPVPVSLSGEQQLALMAQPLDRAEAPTQAATVTVIKDSEHSVGIELVEREGSLPVARVVDLGGVPQPGHAVELDSGDGTLDILQANEAGLVTLPTTMPGMVPRWRIRAPDGIWHHSADATPPSPPATQLDTTNSTPSPSAPFLLRIRGHAGPVTLVWSRVLSTPAAPAPPPPPCLGCTPLTAAFEGPQEWSDATSPPADVVPWATSPSPEESDGTVPQLPRAVELPASGAVDMPVPGLPEGRWRVEAVPDDPFAGTASVELNVGGAGPGPQEALWQAGGTLSVYPATPTLVTLEAAGEVVAQVVGPQGAQLDLPLAERARLSMIDAHGRRHQTERLLQGTLEVDVSAAQHGDRWQVELQLKDPQGRPTDGQVALRAIDQRLRDDLHRLHRGQLSADATLLLLRDEPSPGATSFGAGFTMRRAGEALSQALLAEAKREEAAENAQRASRGDLEGGLGQILMEDTFIGSSGLGALGTRGTGSGGSGYGSGGGSFGGKGARGRIAHRQTLGPSLRDDHIWAVVDVDRTGRATIELPAPPAATWRIEAHAVSAHAAGVQTTTLTTDIQPRLVVPDSTPSAPGTTSDITVYAINPTDSPADVLLDGAATTLAAHGFKAFPLAGLKSGDRRDLTLTTPTGAPLDTAHVWLPVPAPQQPSADGELVRVSVAPGGGPPLRLWLSEEQAVPYQNAGAIARAGRLALVIATSRVSPDLRAYALEQAALRLQEMRIAPHPAGAIDAASVIAFLAEAENAYRTGLRLPEITPGDIEALVKQTIPTVTARDSRDSVALQWALAIADQPADDTTLSRLVRDAERLDAETRAWLARALIERGRLDTARPLVTGDGPHAALARLALGTVSTAPPPMLPAAGHPQRVHAVQVHIAGASTPRGGPATVAVQLDGETIGKLNVQAGGSLTMLAAQSAQVSLSAQVGAVVERGTLHGGSASFATRLRPSVGGIDVTVPRTVKPHFSACGTPERPCDLLVGDALSAIHTRWRHGATCSAGLACTPTTIEATYTGLQVVHGLEQRVAGEWTATAPVWISVHDDPARRQTLPPATALRLAQAEEKLGLDPLPTIAAWSDFDAWPASLRPSAMALRWRQSEGGTATERVAAFEDLRDANPTAGLSLAEVASVARAYAELDRPERAIDIWRAGLGAAFLVEVGPLRGLEEVVGPLPALKALVELPQRYPSLPMVQEAQFHLPGQLTRILDSGLPSNLREAGVTEVDIQLLAAAWHRRFLAFQPRSRLAPEAGLHLAKALLDLDAPEAAAHQAHLSASRAPDDPALDALVFLESLALSRQGRSTDAQRLLKKLAESTDWPKQGGGSGPASLRPDARYALARLAEASGRYEAAAEGYADVSDHFAEVTQAREALVRVSLRSPPIVTTHTKRSTGRTPIPLTSTNVGTAYIRAYALDLRTVFLRDGGLKAVSDLRVDGVSPSWAGQVRLSSGPHTATQDFHLPVSGDGAWLVQVDAEGARTATLVVRSELELDLLDQPSGRRVAVRRGKAVAAQVEVRAITHPGAPVLAARTDERGVVVLPAGAAALVFDGDSVAFTPPDSPPPPRQRSRPQAPTGAPLDRLDHRLKKERQKQNSRYEQTYQLEAEESLKADLL